MSLIAPERGSWLPVVHAVWPAFSEAL